VIAQTLGKPIEQVLDGENNQVEFDIAYPLKGDLINAVEQLRDLHGPEIYLLPMSATSCGGGIFQNENRPPGTIAGLRFDPPASPRLRFESQPKLLEIAQDEIVIDPEHQQISAGSAITLDQLNQALVRELGHCYKVPGADLTSYMYAAVGATFMTGGMGPQRRYFSDSVVEISLYDGNKIVSVEGGALQGYAGTYGWSGIVTALRCNYYQFPANEFAFALPVSGQPAHLAKLLAHLAPYSYLNLGTAQVTAQAETEGLILGIEHVSRSSMQPLLRDASDNPARKRALELEQKCAAAGVDGLVFISGFSDLASDEFLIGLADDQYAADFTIAGIELDHAEIFNDAEEMRMVREAIPYAARTQAASGQFVYKNHSDANIRLPWEDVAENAEQLWQINCDYVASVEQHFKQQDAVNGQILVYGHLNPYGVDPHNRVTMSSDDEDAFLQSRSFLVELRARYYRSLAALCATTNAVFVGGEKTADSEIGIYRALGGSENWPAALFARFRQQRATIKAAAKTFNWRAPEPYN
jgi:FAD/FMN-containing dehydrogenase